jgi:hypothetical protein
MPGEIPCLMPPSSYSQATKSCGRFSPDSSRPLGPALPGPENYLVIALQGLEDGQAGDPEFLATIKDLAAKFEIAEGEAKAVDVRIASPK